MNETATAQKNPPKLLQLGFSIYFFFILLRPKCREITDFLPMSIVTTSALHVLNKIADTMRKLSGFMQFIP